MAPKAPLSLGCASNSLCLCKLLLYTSHRFEQQSLSELSCLMMRRFFSYQQSLTFSWLLITKNLRIIRQLSSDKLCDSKLWVYWGSFKSTTIPKCPGQLWLQGSLCSNKYRKAQETLCRECSRPITAKCLLKTCKKSDEVLCPDCGQELTAKCLLKSCSGHK